MWRKLFDSTWKTFQTRFSRSIESFRRHRELIKNQATFEEFEAVQSVRVMQAEQLKQQKEEASRQRQARVRSWLSAEDMKLEHEDYTEVRRDFPGTGRWILEKRPVKRWLDLDDNHSSLLWLTGIPGAGM